MTQEKAQQQWHPIAASTELVPRHVYHAQLFARELAVWRADDGHVNAWENRCLHRGVRLSIGINDGRELVCQYHGWRYANRTAGCTYIPAHPADAPARTICNNQYPVIEQYGLIWSCEAGGQPKSVEPQFGQPQPDESEPGLPEFAPGPFKPGGQLVLRAIPVNATAAVIIDYLSRYCVLDYSTPALTRPEHEPASNTPPQFTQRNAYAVSMQLDDKIQLDFYLQAVDSDRTIVRGILSGLSGNTDTADNHLTLLRMHNQKLSCIRELAENRMTELTTPAPWQAVITPVATSLSQMPELSITGNSLLRVRVADIRTSATDIKQLKLTGLDGQLPTFHAGAHIDLHLPNGLVRQYSLANGPGQTDCFIIGVKLEANSGGDNSNKPGSGSGFIHNSLKKDDVLAMSIPRNNFPLRRDAVYTILLAGGIGITPLLSMALALKHSSLDFQLHYFLQNPDHLAFSDELKTLGESLIVHSGLTPEQSRSQMQKILQHYKSAHHVYICGPGAMLDAARETAEQYHWPDEAVHFEYFKNTRQLSTDSAFTVALARSGLTLQVPPGKSLLEVLRENGIKLPSSCEQGACGTCRVAVTDGIPLHQDVYLSRLEQECNDCMMTCVSRATSDTLTLDI